MNAPTPNDDDDDAMRAALQRDAARVSEPPFDAALHHAAMRRIRALAERGAETSRVQLLPALATAAALLVMTALLAWWLSHPSPRTERHEMVVDVTPSQAPRTSLLAYQTAANKGDAALFALLDRDAATLLPASPAVFNTPLH